MPYAVISTFSHTRGIVSAEYFESPWLASLTTFIFSIYATEQYSLILEINQPAGHYWMRTVQNLGSKSAAILGSAGSCDVDPEIRTIPDAVTLNETDLHPLYPPPPLLIKEDGVDAKFHLILEKNETNFSFHINGVQCTSHSVPVLLQLLGGDVTGSNLVPRDSVYTLLRDKVFGTLMIPNTSLIHSTSMGCVSRYHLCMYIQQMVYSFAVISYNYINPVMHDTVTAGSW